MSSDSESSSILGRHSNNQALAGVKVLDFGWAIAGAVTAKYLGDYGAEVIKIESISRPDLARMNRNISLSKADNPDDKPWYVILNTSKFGIRLNIRHPRARGVIDKLIHWADVINENFVPGTLAKLGYDYEYARTINPGVIMVSASAFGQIGPYASEWGIDSTGSAASATLDLTGWQDRGPSGPQYPFGDCTIPFISVMAVVAALDYRRRTGKGQHIDTAMIDLCTHPVAPALLDWQVNGHLQTRSGNRIPNAAPHGVFPCRGEDRWCAIAVFTEREWDAFCRAIGSPSWTQDERFATLQLRKEKEDALEELVSEWTRRHSAEDVMKLMQELGVPAGVVQTTEDVVDRDPQLRQRGFLLPLEHPVLGVFGHPTPGYRLSRTEAQVRTSPCLGEHLDYVCTQVLGMSDEEFVELLQDGVFN